jgi:protein-S-isoprenylcysteine O-methyltransferase Ste14
MNSDYISTRESSLALRLGNVGASAAVVAFSCAIYALAPYNGPAIDGLYVAAGHEFTGGQFLFAAAGAYVLALAAYFGAQAQPLAGKSLRFWSVVARFARSPAAVSRQGLAPADRVAVLATLLKAFFGPFMVVALMQHVLGALANGYAILYGGDADLGWLELFNRHGFWLALKIILFVDVLIFTVGYLVESPRLKNEIRSVDPTLLGWAAALLCYPPFNELTGAILGSTVSDFPQFEDPMAHLSLNVLLLVLMAIYASASVALGLKASNLTHRGIVARGPYAVVRHPAYVAKNMAWWIGSVPVVAASFGESLFTGVAAVASVAGWSLLYVLRALTEEDHLRRVDGEYAAYAARVRWRFIPGVY